MKNFLAMLFFLALLCPVSANDLINSEVREEVNKMIIDGVAEGKEQKDSSLGASKDSVVRIMFKQTAYVEDSSKPLINNYKDCIAVVIDDAWAVASSRCYLMYGDDTRKRGKVIDVETENFKIQVGKDFKEVTDVFKLKNLILLRVLNKNNNPVFVNYAKAKLFFVPQDVDAKSLTEKAGKYIVNRTDKNHPAYDAAHDRIEDNFQPYKTGRDLYTKGIESVSKTKEGIIATLDWIKQVRAGDPLFYIEDGKEYLLGLGYAVNLDDRESEARTDQVRLLTVQDQEEIINKVRSVDEKAAVRLENNILK